MKSNIGIVIPCYKANGFVNKVVERIINTTNTINNIANFKIYLVNDCCPNNSWQEVSSDFDIEIIHHSKNLGVGSASKSGFYAALKDKCDSIIKIDADGQHPPEYLAEIIKFLISRPDNELLFIKGSRYYFRNRFINIPIIRRLGSLILEPIARVGLNYRGLTDIANGFIATNSLTLNYLFSINSDTKIFSRYLFECSLLGKICSLGCEIYQFPMVANYGKNWQSSMEAKKMIIPILSFWFKTIIRRIFNQYFFNLNLGTLLLTIFTFAISWAIHMFYFIIKPSISSGVFVSAGIASTFTSMITISSVFLFLFFYYDYQSGKRIKVVNFKYYLKDILSQKKIIKKNNI